MASRLTQTLTRHWRLEALIEVPAIVAAAAALAAGAALAAQCQWQATACAQETLRFHLLEAALMSLLAGKRVVLLVVCGSNMRTRLGVLRQGVMG